MTTGARNFKAAVVVAAAAIAVLIVVAVALVLVLGDGGDAALETGGGDEAARAAAALLALAEGPVDGIAKTALEEMGDRATDALPPGTILTPVERTWAPDGVGGGVMQVGVKTPDGGTTEYAAVLVEEDGAWKVLATFPLESGSTEGGPE